MVTLSPLPEHLARAELLAAKATGSLLVARKLATFSDVDDDAIGLHTQQAVEKALKAGLALCAGNYPDTHDLDFLSALSQERQIGLPDNLTDIGWLTPWGEDFRYEEPQTDTLDRDRAIEVSQAAVTWCQDLLATTRDPPPPPPPSIPGLGRPETRGSLAGKRK